MTFRNMIQTKIMGRLVMEREGDALRLEGHFPNPEKGARFFAGVMILALLILVGAPALYYGAPDSPPQSLGALPGAIITGIPSALAPLVELARTWEPGKTPPDLQGWGFGLGLAISLPMFGILAAHLYRDLTDRPYLAVELRGDALSIQRGLFGTPLTIPRDECRGVHVARRRSGFYEVLIQHGGTLTPVAIVTGSERRALLLKVKIDAMLAGDGETALS